MADKLGDIQKANNQIVRDLLDEAVQAAQQNSVNVLKAVLAGSKLTKGETNV